MNNKLNIGILGCGWLGLPLGKYLFNKGYQIYGSTTTNDKIEVLRNNNIIPDVLKLEKGGPTGNTAMFNDCKILIINIPPLRSSPDVIYYEEKILRYLTRIDQSKVKHILFVSSTSVYGQEQKALNENDRPKPISESGKQLLKVEDLLANHFKWQNTIIRFGGLIGYDRIPGRFLSKKKGLKKGGSAVNLIHQDDCIEAIYQIIKQDKWGYTYNVCSPEHPSKIDFYTKAAQSINLAVPEFEDLDDSGKSISSELLIEELHFKFKYKNPIDCIF
jgi:nucleoside-diphosphate-sugar epimerase